MILRGIATLGVVTFFSLPALSQEQLNNGTFETPPTGATLSVGNNVGLPAIPGWVDQANQRNLVMVDGTSTYGPDGPSRDATPPLGGIGHYYDGDLLTPGTGTIRQSFTPNCTTASVSAQFSSRGGVGVNQAPFPSVSITNTSGVVGTFSVVVPDEPNLSSENALWVGGTAQMTLTPGAIHTIFVSMPNQVNVDQVSVFCVLPQITYSKQATSAGPFQPGDTVSFVVTPTLANAPIPAGTQLTMTDLGVPGLTLVATSGNGWNCPSTTPGICTIVAPTGGIPVGGLNPVTYTYVVDSPQVSGTLANCATMTETVFGSLSNTQISTQQACASISVRNPVRLHHYAVKYVCGFSVADDPNPVGPVTSTGAYYTEINILNPDWREADVEKYITPLVIQGEKAFREPDLSAPEGYEKFTMTSQTGTMDDCQKLGEMMGESNLALRPVDIGFLSIYSTRPLDVTAVYTAMGVFEDQHNTALDVEQIEGRVVELLR